MHEEEEKKTEMAESWWGQRGIDIRKDEFETEEDFQRIKQGMKRETIEIGLQQYYSQYQGFSV